MVIPFDEIERVGIIGAGTMGSGIAQVVASAGYDVLIQDADDESLDRGIAIIEENLDRGVRDTRLTENRSTDIWDRIDGTTNLADLAKSDFVIEAVIEDIDIKQHVLSALDALVRDEVVLATNTSTLSITSLGSATD